MIRKCYFGAVGRALALYSRGHGYESRRQLYYGTSYSLGAVVFLNFCIASEVPICSVSWLLLNLLEECMVALHLRVQSFELR